jgi:hypothetical protein
MVLIALPDEFVIMFSHVTAPTQDVKQQPRTHYTQGALMTFLYVDVVR